MGEPYFVPGTPVVVDRKGLGDARPGDLVSVTTGRGRARVERVIGPAKRIENVLEALLVGRGAARGLRAARRARSRRSRAAPTSAT